MVSSVVIEMGRGWGEIEAAMGDKIAMEKYNRNKLKNK